MTSKRAGRGVLLDTAPLYALLTPTDQHHARAKVTFDRLSEGGEAAFLPYPIATELHRLILYRKPEDPIKAEQAVTRTLSVYPPLLPGEADVMGALALLRAFGDQRISLADATLAAMANRLGATVLTFDARHFALLKARVFE